MRTLLKVRVPVAAGNRAITDGTLPQIIGKFVEVFRPEASYFILKTATAPRCLCSM